MINEKTNKARAAALRVIDHRTVVEPFRPIIDGDEFTQQPLAMLQDGDWNTEADVIIGTNREELWDVIAIFDGRNVSLSLLTVSDHCINL